jgi:hypothetical protein
MFITQQCINTERVQLVSAGCRENNVMKSAAGQVCVGRKGASCRCVFKWWVVGERLWPRTNKKKGVSRTL